MTDNPRLTEERLRTWLDGRTVERERMCLAVLSLDRRYSDIQPRRPKGGPDGARDIQATLLGETVWGAVGFRNHVSDSPTDKRAIKKKFAADLDAALAAKPDLHGFIFFTNVDLTLAETQRLIANTRARGVSHVDVYTRERIRIALDSPEGLAFRFQYLAIPLSDAEQAAFFARFGSDIQELLTRELGRVSNQLARLEFLQECQKPLRRLAFGLDFSKPLTPEELGQYRFLFVIQSLGTGEPHPSLSVAGRDAYPTFSSGGQVELRHGHQHIGWAINPDTEFQATVISYGEKTIRQLLIETHVRSIASPYATLGSLDDQTVWVYCTPSLLSHLSGVALIANDYVLAYEKASELASMNGGPLVALPIHLTDQPSGEPWISLLPKGPQYAEFERDGSAMSSPPLALYRPWMPSFSTYTPWRVPLGSTDA
jgi:hypothetical protein